MPPPQLGLRDDGDDWPTPNLSTRPVREYLSSLDPDQQPAKRISLTDPQARWTAAPGGPAFFAYSTNYLIDVDAGIIVDVEATPAYRPDEVNSTKTTVALERLTAGTTIPVRLGIQIKSDIPNRSSLTPHRRSQRY